MALSEVIFNEHFVYIIVLRILIQSFLKNQKKYPLFLPDLFYSIRNHKSTFLKIFYNISIAIRSLFDPLYFFCNLRLRY